jgi:hypothetical protein
MKKFKADDVILVEGSKFEFGSIVSYAMDNGECPIEALAWLEHSKVKWPHAGHVSHWLSPTLVCLSRSGSVQKAVRGVVQLGEVVEFEGRCFKLEKANNDNVDLIDNGPTNKFKPSGV